jgi:hypothetical protein
VYHQRTTPALIELAKQSPEQRSWLSTDEQSVDIRAYLSFASTVFKMTRQLSR